MVFGLTRTGLEHTIYPTRCEHAKHHPTDTVKILKIPKGNQKILFMCLWFYLLFAFSFGHFYGIFYEVFVFVDKLPNYDASYPAASNLLFLQSLSRDTNVMLLILRPFYNFYRHANVMLNTIKVRYKLE